MYARKHETQQETQQETQRGGQPSRDVSTGVRTSLRLLRVAAECAICVLRWYLDVRADLPSMPAFLRS